MSVQQLLVQSLHLRALHLRLRLHSRQVRLRSVSGKRTERAEGRKKNEEWRMEKPSP